MREIKVSVQNKIATAETGAVIVCGNADYTIKFDFDDEWSGHNLKTALFAFKKGVVKTPFDGDTCEVPIIRGSTIVGVGVTSSNGLLKTTTPAYIKCLKSVGDIDGAEIEPPTQSEYDTIVELLNSYIEMGAMTKEEVVEVVREETENLQPKEDNELQTTSKTIVGAINETLGIATDGKDTAETALKNAGQAQETADTANKTANVACGVAQTACETAERAEKTVNLIDDIASQALNVSAQALSIASRLDITAIESKVEKTNEPNQLYGTDENGNPALYPTDSVGTQVLVDGQKVKEFNADEKFDKTGGVVVGNVTIQGNLFVSGENSVVDTETLRVKDNVIVANAGGTELAEDGGFAIKTNATEAYGIMYDPVGDGVKIGLGGFDENGKFTYNENQAQFLATRADTITDGHIPKWDNEKKQFVDSGEKIGDYVKSTDYATESKAGVVKINNFMGVRVDSNGTLYLDTASDSEIAKQQGNNAIKVYQTPQAVKSGLLKHDNVEWADEDKAKACETIGAVKKATTPNRLSVYAIDEKGNAVLIGTSINASNNGMVPLYSPSGNINVDTPTHSYHATSKKYVDDNFVARIKPPSGSFAYGNNAAGEVQYLIADSATAWSIARRGNDGSLNIGTPTEDTHAVNKKYAEDNFISKNLYGGIIVSAIGYGPDGDIVQTDIEVDTTNAYTIPMRNVKGVVFGSIPSENDEYGLTPKKYVDENKGTKLYLHKMESVSLIDSSPTQKTPEEMVQALTAPTSIERRLGWESIISASTRLQGSTPTKIDIYFYNEVLSSFESRTIDFSGMSDTVTEL